MRCVASISRSRPRSSSCCSARRAAASRRCSTSSAGLDTASSGRLFFGTQELTDADQDELTEFRRDHVGFVFQFYNLIPSLTARENVALVTEIAGDPTRCPATRSSWSASAGSRRPLPGPALRRRATARRHRPRHRQAPGGPAVRRAHRRARRQDRHPGARRAGAGQPRAGHRDRRDHPQRADRHHGGPRDHAGRRPHRRRGHDQRRPPRTRARDLVLVSVLDRKLPRDLRRLRGQVAGDRAGWSRPASRCFVTLRSVYAWLATTRTTYYDRYRFGDVFAHLVRAPQQVAAELEAIPGVASVYPRILHEVLLPLPDSAEPAIGRLVSVPSGARPPLNAVYLRSGRMPAARCRHGEVGRPRGLRRPRMTWCPATSCVHSSTGGCPRCGSSDRDVTRVRVRGLAHRLRRRRQADRRAVDGPGSAGARVPPGVRVQRRRLPGCSRARRTRQSAREIDRFSTPTAGSALSVATDRTSNHRSLASSNSSIEQLERSGRADHLPGGRGVPAQRGALAADQDRSASRSRSSRRSGTAIGRSSCTTPSSPA